MIISVVNEKGGVGKTTLSINMSFYLANKNKKVLLIDSDTQKSTQTWAEIRSANNKKHVFNSIFKAGKSLKDELLLSSQNYDYIIVDTAGRDNVESRIALVNCNITIIPCVVSALDVDVVLHVLNIVNETKIINQKLQTYILINRLNTNIHVKQDFFKLKSFLENKIKELELENVRVLNSCIFERQSHKNYIAKGLSVFELENDKSKDEYLQLMKELNF